MDGNWQMDPKCYQTSYKIEMLINQTCPSHVHNGWSQILQSTNRIGNKPGTHFFVWSQQRDRQRAGVQEWSKPIECKKAWICWSVWAGGRSIGSHAREPPTVQQCSSAIAHWAPPAGSLISISMSASCSQYVITILPGFLALTANLKLQRLSFVRIQLVVKEVAQKKLLHYEQLCHA